MALASTLACSQRTVDSGARSRPIDSTAAAASGQPDVADEVIPAEWTVFEDTSETGEVITASLQLPTARDIQGLLNDNAARLILRCVNGRVEASIDTEAGDAAEARSDSGGVSVEMVPIRLDSAPTCE